MRLVIGEHLPSLEAIEHGGDSRLEAFGSRDVIDAGYRCPAFAQQAAPHGPPRWRAR
jgi:hypothetical protein